MSIEAILKKLSEKIPDDLIKHRKQGKEDIAYIEWHTAANFLDKHAPSWSNEIKEVGLVGDMVFVRVAITIEGVTRENIGYEAINKKGYGDPFSNAFAKGLKRATALFGLARELYDKEDRVGDQNDDKKRTRGAASGSIEDAGGWRPARYYGIQERTSKKKNAKPYKAHIFIVELQPKTSGQDAIRQEVMLFDNKEGPTQEMVLEDIGHSGIANIETSGVPCDAHVSKVDGFWRINQYRPRESNGQ